MKTSMHTRTPGAAGFSLVELMVSIALSVLLLGGVAAMFVSSRTTYEANDRLARVEENGRFALASIVRDLRSAGYVGCSKLAASYSTLRGFGSGLWKFDLGVEAYNASTSGTWTPTLDTAMVPSPLAGSDVLLVRVPRPGVPALRLRAPMASPTDDIAVPIFPTGHQGAFKNNQILMISDCDARTTFEITAYNAQAGTIKHVTSAATATSPGNESDHLKHTYLTSSQTISLQSVVYYVRNDTTNNNTPTLYRRIDSATPEPLVEGVEMLQLRFGEDTNNDRLADVDVKANDVTNPLNIVSVSVALLVRSPEQYGAKEDRTYQLLDTSVNTSDSYMRRVFATTAAIRNTAP